MTKITNLGIDEAIKAVQAMDTIEEVRTVATDLDIKFSGNTGLETLKTKIVNTLSVMPSLEIKSEIDFGGQDEEIEIAKPIVKQDLSVSKLLTMDPTLEKNPNIRRQIIRAQALKLVRVKITNLDPSDAMLSGAIISMQSKYTGKVAKYVPFGDESENGYHIPQIIYDHIKGQKFALRKEAKGGRFGVKTYKTTMVNKFAIEVLPPLSRQEFQELAAHQRASQAIDI